MPKNDNAHAIRLVESLKKNNCSELAEQLECQYPLSKSASIEKKFEWAKQACSVLEDNLSEEEIINVRKACICNDGASNAKKLLKYWGKASNAKAFIEEFNQSETFASMEYISENKLLFCYPECYCGCVKRIPENLTKTWCYCTIGFAQSMFGKVFQTDVKVTLTESIKTGASRCAMLVEW